MGAKSTRNTASSQGVPQEPTEPTNTENNNTTPTTEQDAPIGVEAEQAAIRARIAQLEELQKLQEREEELRKLISCPTSSSKGNNRAKRRRNSSESSGSSGREIKVKNINSLTHPTNPQKHKIWVNDLNRAFNGAKRRYRRDYRKILFALDHMNTTCRARWDRYLEEQPDNDRESLEDNWEAFQDWTLTLLKDAANREAQIAMQLEKAKQLEGQSPIDFSIYLDSLEKHLERASEKARALTLFAKLRPELQDHINLHASIVDKTREEVVQLAQRFWDAMPGKNKRRQDNPSGRPNTNKTPRLQQGDSPGPRRPFQPPPPWKNQPPNPNNTEPRFKPRCYNCGQEGHIRPNCTRPPKEGQNQQGNGQRPR